MKNSYVYVMASRKNGALYIGVTSDLIKRVYQHREKVLDCHTKKYNVVMLVYYEIFTDIQQAITREKRLKTWQRGWKIRIIEEFNPEWRDIFNEIVL